MTPLLQFPGHVVYAQTLTDIQAVCNHLLEVLNSSKRMVLGFDMEWAYMPEKPVALIQLCARVTAQQPALLTLPSDSGCSASTAAGRQQCPTVATQHSDGSTGLGEQIQPSGAKRRKGTPRQQAVPSAGAAAVTQSSAAPPGATAGPAAAAATCSSPLQNAQQPEQGMGQQQQQQQQVEQLVCYLLHLARLGPTGKDRAVPELKQLLEHPKVFLVTAGNRDEEKLQEDLDIAPANLEQVNMMHFLLQAELQAAGETALQPRQQCKRKRHGKVLQQQQQQQQLDACPAVDEQAPRRREVISLAALVGLYLHKRLDKSCQTANEAWELELTAHYKQYAAIDAYAQMLVFECIKAKLRTLLASETT